jgi:uncharacterized membrane protein
MSVVNVNVTGGLAGIGVALLALALASEHFGDMLLYWICLFGGIITLGLVIITRTYAWAKSIQEK